MKVINIDLPNTIKQLTILVLADVHLEDPLCDEKRVVQFVEEVKNDPCTYFLVNGDIFNNPTRNAISDIWRERMSTDDAIDFIIELLRPIKDKCLVLTDGNHEKRLYKQGSGGLLVKQVARALQIEDRYSYEPYLLFLAFGKNKGRANRKTVYSIYGRHGYGGGRKAGGKINKLMEMVEIINADIFIHSHTHLQAILREESISVDYRNRKPQYKSHLFVNSNAFLKYGGYGEEFGFRPVSSIYPKIYLDGYERLARGLV